jgi:hypothetical protein
MPRTCKTPADQAGASRDSCGGRSQTLPTVQAYQVQFLTMAHAVRPEWAAMMAALAFGGGAP